MPNSNIPGYTGWGATEANADYASKHNGQAYNAGGNNTADAYYTEASGQENKYIDDLISQAGGRRDLILKKLDTEHKLALGNDDSARAQFIENVADQLEQRTGRIPYDYQRYSDRELKQYSMGSKNIADNKKLALDKLTADDQLQRTSLNQQQTQSNRNLAETLNSRGIAEGQSPTGITPGGPSTSNNSINGYSGLAGSEANIQNQGYNNQFNAINNATVFGQRGTNLEASQQQGALDLNHTNTLEDLKVDARRGAQDEQNNFTLGSQGANLDYEAQKQALERQRQQLLEQDRINANSKAAINKGIPGY